MESKERKLLEEISSKLDRIAKAIEHQSGLRYPERKEEWY
jgi:hypothetical protein